MILWHYTIVAPETVGATLLPGENSWRDWLYELGPATPQEDVIWLTSVKGFSGRPSRWAYKCVIPSTDRKLVRFEKLLRKGKAGLIYWREVARLEGIPLSHWYVYSGPLHPVEAEPVQFSSKELRQALDAAGMTEKAQKVFAEKCGITEFAT
jgi:hypothetical protein